MVELSLDLLRQVDDRTSTAIIALLKEDASFQELSKRELDFIFQRDEEDARKLQAGVDQAIARGVLPSDLVPPLYKRVDVLGKTADQVAEEIIADLPTEGGYVVVLCGLSGTGKGTTVEKLRQKLPNPTTWSNGNCFRCFTLLAVTHCEQLGIPFDASVLTAVNLKTWASMLDFGQFSGQYDIRVRGLGIDALVADVVNTTLKEPKVAKNIPTVAQETQGEVVQFASAAVSRMGSEGTVVLAEGREQTLNFVGSPYRFCLTMSDPTMLGSRRAAQLIAASAAKVAKDGDDPEQLVRAALEEVKKN